MTIADQLRSFPVPPRHVLIAGAGEIERLRRENERLKSYEAIYERLVHFENEATHLAAERDALESELADTRKLLDPAVVADAGLVIMLRPAHG